MDPATIFVLCITACIVAILAYLKLRGAETLQEPDSEVVGEADDRPLASQKTRKK